MQNNNNKGHNALIRNNDTAIQLGLYKLGLLTWWTIGTLLLTNFLTIYIHFSHTLAGVVTTSLTVLYLPSNPLQPCSIACVSFLIITRLLILIC